MLTPFPDSVSAAIDLAANGQAGARDFLITFYGFTQSWDDLLDRDKPVDPDEAHHWLGCLFTTLLANPWVKQHSEFLLGLIASAVLRNRDGDRMKNPVVRCGDTDVLVMVAWLTRGANTHDTLQVTPKLRDYDSA